MNQNPDRHSIRRIVLPSGRSVEVAQFYLDGVYDERLHICRRCDSQLVQPIRWTEAPKGLWELTLRCPNCDAIRQGVFEQAQVDLLEDRLDQGLSEMLSDLRRLAQYNMAEEIDRFTTALRRDLILPEDF
jgi:hypothetical protein